MHTLEGHIYIGGHLIENLWEEERAYGDEDEILNGFRVRAGHSH